MNLTTLDYSIIIGFFSITLIVGLLVAKKSGKSSEEFFLSGKNMPWWLLGLSMVATTFSTDTPNLVTDLVRQNGVSGNWVWWAFLISGLLTVFIYAKLWRKSNVNTDIEFYDLRYGGKPAKFLRNFRALYLGVIFNILAMSVVSLAAIKIGNVMLGLNEYETIGAAAIITVIFSAIGGFKGVVYTDSILFFSAMIGAVGAAYYCVNLPEVGGLDGLLNHKNLIGKTSILPDFDKTEALISILIIPLAVQWWAAWYPGAEPGGGGYIAQRMLAAKDENHAIGATFFFNIMHYALRPWPWILVALCSLVIFPDLESIKEAFPNIPKEYLKNDIAYSAMLTKLPSGLLGLVLASLIAAYMSTISTHLNWGSSYVVNDFWKQSVNPNASEKELVNVGRGSTVVLMVISSILAINLNNAKQIFDIIIMFGAGTGAIFLLRWFWWRINAWSEISAMFISGFISILFFIYDIELFTGQKEIIENGILKQAEITPVFISWVKIPLSVALTTTAWLVVTFLTKPEKNEVLYDFYKKIQPGGPGWKKIIGEAHSDGQKIVEENAESGLSSGIIATLIGSVLIYSLMFATGNLIYGNFALGLGLVGVSAVMTFILIKMWKKIKANIL